MFIILGNLTMGFTTLLFVGTSCIHGCCRKHQNLAHCQSGSWSIRLTWCPHFCNTTRETIEIKVSWNLDRGQIGSEDSREDFGCDSSDDNNVEEEEDNVSRGWNRGKHCCLWWCQSASGSGEFKNTRITEGMHGLSWFGPICALRLAADDPYTQEHPKYVGYNRV
jgi:hypothetical protein